MQDAERLTRAVVDRHASANEVFADLGEFDADVRRHGNAEAADLLESDGLEPDGHEGSDWRIADSQKKNAAGQIRTAIGSIRYSRVCFFLNFSPTRRYASRKGMPSFTTISFASAAA